MTGSLKDAVKALTTTFAAPTVSHPLPEELQRTIEEFLARHQHIDDYDSQRLHEELLSIFNKLVVDNADKHGPFVQALRLLRPAIRGESRLEEWWSTLIRPTIDAIGHKRDTIEDAREFLLGILVFDSEDPQAKENAALSSLFLKKLLDAYLARTIIPSADDVVSPEDEFIAHELEGILVAFGRKKPKELLVAIDEILVHKDRRLQALSLLSSFVRLQPPHLYLVLETPLIQHLHSCLLIDGSTTVVDLALTILIMFMPHITTSLVSDLPKLFLIYARVLCWDQYTKDGYDRGARSEQSESEHGSESDPSPLLHFDPSWDAIDSGIDGVQSITPKANYLFTFLYGLFPLNFMNFVRKSRRYLKMKSYPNAGDLDLHQTLIRTRTETHRVQHRLHPNFFNTTPEDELTDNRWLKSDPADLVSECLGLCIAVSMSFSDPGPPPTTKLPALPRRTRKQSSRTTIPVGDEETITVNGALSPVDSKPGNSWRNTQSSTLTGSSSNYNMEPLKIPARQSSNATLLDPVSRSSRNNSPPGQTFTEELVESPVDSRPQTPKRGDFKFCSSAPPSPPRWAATPAMTSSRKLQTFAQALSRFPMPTPGTQAGEGQSAAILQREVMILRNDLNFERFQKQKYLEQIGHLQRKHVGEITVESDTQNLINKNRTLKNRLLRADERHEQLKKEMATSRSQAKKFEDQLNSKLKNYREDERRWHLESQTLRHELDIARKECEELKKIVVETERRENDSRNRFDTMDRDLENLNSLRSSLLDVEAKLREYELRDLEFDRTKEEQEIMRNELETARLKLNSAEAERERMRRQYEQKIMAIETNSRNSTQSGPGQLPASVQQMIDSALAASQSKLTQLRKNYTQLHHKFLELEIRNQELEGQTQRPGSVLSLTQYADGAPPATMGKENPHRVRSVRHHDFNAEPRILEEEYVPMSEGSFQLQQQSDAHFSGTTSPVGLFTDRDTGRFVSPLASRGVSPAPHMALDQVSTHDFQANPTEVLSNSSRSGNSSRSAHSIERDGTGNKVHSQSETRVFGRGGAQNIKKTKDSLIKKEKSTKTGGFRGLKGIM